MSITEILQFVDSLVFTETDQHLDDLQKRIIEELFKGKTYKQIADLYNYDEGYIGDESRKLFKILSDKLGENINKSNFSWTIERVINSKIVSFGNHNINCYSDHPSSQNQSNNKEETQKSSYHDLILSPKINRCYGREKELEYLSNFILNQNTSLISVLGLSGIGKTTLVKRFVDLNLDQFQVIIWKSCKYPKSLKLVIDDLLQVCQEEPEKNMNDKIKQLFNILTIHKTLIIFDDVQNLFVSGEFAGEYQAEYQDYQNFFTLITKTSHQSNIILISQEKCTEMQSLDQELYPVQCLELSGLEDVEIFNNTGLKNETCWLNLIKLYAGNPFYLQSVAILIKNVFAGDVAEFLGENEFVITKDMQVNLHQLFQKISSIEKQIILGLSQFDQPVSRADLRNSLQLSYPDFINGLESLQKRYLVEKSKDEKILFSILPVFREYVRDCH